MTRFGQSFGLVSLAVLVFSLVIPGTALAHDKRLVSGKYSFEVGFLNEPALVGQVNGIDLTVTIPSANDKPVEGLENSLTAMVIVGGNWRTMVVPLEPREGEPGAYSGYFIPTIEGSYQFQFSGKVENTIIEEVFESGPDRFSDVQSPQLLQFPDKLPDPSVVASEVRAARYDSSIARLFGLAGLGMGMAGLVVGGVSIMSRWRPPGSHESEER